MTEPGPDAVAYVQNRIDAFAAGWQDSYPSAVRCLLADRATLPVYPRFPREHWQRIRHSNFIQRTFGETRRRVKVIGRLPGEHSCLGLVWAVLDRASAGWRGFTMTPAGLRLLQDLRRTLLAPPQQLRPTGHATLAPPHHQQPKRSAPSPSIDITSGSLRPAIYTARRTRPPAMLTGSVEEYDVAACGPRSGKAQHDWAARTVPWPMRLVRRSGLTERRPTSLLGTNRES